MRSLKFIADGNTTTKIGDARFSYQYSSSPSSINQNNLSRSSSYDPAAVFFLELMINVTLQNRDRIHYLWQVNLKFIVNYIKKNWLIYYFVRK